MLVARRRDSGLSRSTGSAPSMRTDTTWRYSVFGPERLGRGPMLFTGPDAIRDHRVAVDEEHRYIGEGTMSPEGTSEVDYLWRAPKCIPFPRPKSSCVGEIGWGVPQFTDWNTLLKGSQIRLGEFRQAVEDRHTHLYQNAWYPGPNDNMQPNSDDAIIMNVYQPRKKVFDRYGRPVPQSNTGHKTERRDIGRARSASSASSCSSRRSIYSHYSDSLTRPKTAHPEY